MMNVTWNIITERHLRLVDGHTRTVQCKHHCIMVYQIIEWPPACIFSKFVKNINSEGVYKAKDHCNH